MLWGAWPKSKLLALWISNAGHPIARWIGSSRSFDVVDVEVIDREGMLGMSAFSAAV